MKKNFSQFVCNQCGYESVQWYGKCPNCGQWNTMVEFRVDKGNKRDKKRENLEAAKPVKLSEIKVISSARISSGITEFDRVLGGGFVTGSVSLLAGDPGIGKSTLLLGLCKNVPSLYVCGEESPEQVKLRAERMGVKNENLLLLPETNVERIVGEIGEDKENKGLVIIDSIQTLWSEEIEGYPGSISQVRGCSQKLIEVAKKQGITMVIVGHVNKEGEIAGPMILAHMVDTVLFLEGERFADLRLLRGIKNRFGPTDEVGVFRMTEKGMEEVKNPSELFVRENGGNKGDIGSVTICAMEGTRPILLEIQALVTQSALAIPRRVASGVDYNRVLLLAAVLQKNLGIPLYKEDIYIKVGGGFKVSEPAADLGICLAIASSFRNKPVAAKTCVFGEVGLLGEVRRVNGEEKRIKEAKKFGFANILSTSTVRNLQEAMSSLQK